ncbi:MAG: hypothetical protein WDZ51_01525 [Pirellulaceae bacterium]
MIIKPKSAGVRSPLPSVQASLTAVLLWVAMMASSAEAQQRTYDFQLVARGAVIARDGPKTGFPSVIRVPEWVAASQRAAPQANYYLYYGTHHGNYIRMKWAESIDGPWTEYNVGGRFNGVSRRGVFDVTADPTRESYGHIASPDVHVDHANRRFVMFYHGENQPSTVTRDGTQVPQVHQNFVSTSGNGLDFHDPLTAGGQERHGPRTVTVDGITRDIWIGPSYQRAFQHRGHWYSLSKRAVMSKAREPRKPFGHNVTDPFGQAWTVDGTPDRLWHEDASRVQPSYFSPAASFLASDEFAEHANNPHPGTKILSQKERINHVSCRVLPNERLEIVFYVRLDPDDRYNALYRLEYDISAPDFEQWEVARDEAGKVLFEVILSPEEFVDAVNSVNPGFNPIYTADPVSLGSSTIFVDDDSRIYLFFSYVSQRFSGNDGEGQITAVELVPR